MARTSKLDCVAPCLLCALIVSIGDTCMAADDPQAVSLIRKYLPDKAIDTKTDDSGAVYIVGISIPSNQPTTEIFPVLAKLLRLEELRVGYKALKDSDLELLPPLPNLRLFGTNSPLITDEGLEHLSPMQKLEELGLEKTQVRGPGLASLKHFTELRRLHVSNTPLDDRGIPHIVANFPKLHDFYFNDTKVSLDGVMQLADLHWLQTIDFPHDLIGPDPKTGKTKEERRRLDRVRQRNYFAFCVKFIVAYEAAKQKARAAGLDVPPDDVGPFGGSRNRLEKLISDFDENGDIRLQ